MAEREHDPRLGVTPAQVAGSALAAVSGAVFASWAGTTGTIIGAALGSVIATVGSAAYTWWLRRTSAVVRERADRVRQATLRINALPRTVNQGPMRDPEESPEVDAPEKPKFPWGRVAVAAALVLVVALAGITLFEAFTGKPVASLVGQDHGKGTTLGHVVGSDPKPTHTPTPTPSPSPAAPSPTGGSPSPATQSPTPTPPPTLLPSPSAGAPSSGSATPTP